MTPPPGPGDDEVRRNSYEDMDVPTRHAEVVEGPAGRYRVTLHASGTWDLEAVLLAEELILAPLGWLVHRTVMRRRWTVQVVEPVTAPGHRPAVLHRVRVPRRAALATAVTVRDDVRAGRLPSSSSLTPEP